MTRWSLHARNESNRSMCSTIRGKIRNADPKSRQVSANAPRRAQCEDGGGKEKQMHQHTNDFTLCKRPSKKLAAAFTLHLRGTDLYESRFPGIAETKIWGCWERRGVSQAGNCDETGRAGRVAKVPKNSYEMLRIEYASYSSRWQNSPTGPQKMQGNLATLHGPKE